MFPKKVIFIHGNGAMSWANAWTPALQRDLSKMGVENIFETFPDSILARKQYWMPFLHDYLQADENTLLIGWSSGAVAAMRYAQEYKIFGSILIAPCYTDLGLETEKVSGWYDAPWEWEKIKNNQKQIALFYSNNDEYIPLSEFEMIQDKLQPVISQAFEYGHFTKLKEFPEVVKAVEKMLNLS